MQPRNRMRGIVLGAFGLTACFAAGCGRTAEPSQPRPSVAQVKVLRPQVKLKTARGKSMDLSTGKRLESSTEVATGAAGRALVKLDLGATVLMDRASRVKVEEDGVRLLEGRIWVDSAAEVEVRTAHGTVRSVKAGFDVALARNAARVYCGSGEVTYVHAKATKTKGKGRLETGMTVVLEPDKAQLLPEALWEDWTAGLAQPGPRRAEPPAGIGQLDGRTSAEMGMAPSPLLTRQHDVKVRLFGDMAVTEVTQTFFNPRSATVDGIYRVRLPRHAIISEFAVGSDPQNLNTGSMVARFREASSSSVPNAVIEWAGADRYQGMVRYIGPGKTVAVRLTYIQWLERETGRRVYVYPMGGGRAPLLGEFFLEVDLSKIPGSPIQASLGARRKGSKIFLRRSDYRPQADFVLELLDPAAKKPEPVLYRAALARPAGRGRKASSVRGAAGEKPLQQGTLYLVVDPPLGKPPEKLHMAVVADLSAGLDPAQVKLIKDTVDAALSQLKESDHVAVLAANLDVRVLGGKDPFGPATAKRRQALLDELARTRASGATDLGQALEKAALLLPKGRGVVVYVGDGQPTSGQLLPGPIKTRLARLGVPPRVFTLGVGATADMDFLHALAGEAGLAQKIETRPEASRAVFRVISLASRPSLRGVTLEMPSPVEGIYPARPFTVVAGQQIRALARCKGKVPTEMKIRGLRDGKPFELKLKAKLKEVTDQGDLRRRWASARIAELLQQGGGREAIADVGMRFGVMTAWTALAVGAYQGYRSTLPEPPPGIFSVESMQAGRRPSAHAATVSLEPSWLAPRRRTVDWSALYRYALWSRSAPARLCFERKAAGHPELAGRVDLKIELRPDGTVKKVDQTYSSLDDAEVEACIRRAVEALRLPAPPPGAPTVFTHTFHFTSPEGRHAGPIKCSKASYQYLTRRRVLWRERLARNPGVNGAMSVWFDAFRKCELKTWLDRRTLLDLMLKHVYTVERKIQLYHRFFLNPGLQRYLRHRILRSLRTRADVEQARVGLNLDGYVDWELLEKGLKKAKATRAKVDLVRKFLALSPDSLPLKALLMRLYEKAGQPDSAEELAWQIRSDPAAHAAFRQEVGEFFLRRKRRDEARRAFSEMVEMAPYDPWARQRLGHLYLAHGWCADAYREYETLAWLQPHDVSVLLMMARAAFCQGRLDEALRLQARVSESEESGGVRFAQSGTGRTGPAAWARVMTSVVLARLRQAASKAGDKAKLGLLKARGRRLGLRTWAGELLIALTWTDPAVSLGLSIQYPGDELLKPVEVKATQLGLQARRMRRQLPGEHHVEVRLAGKLQQRVKPIEAELVLLWGEGTDKEQLVIRKVTLDPENDARAFKLKGRELTPTKPKKKKEKKKEEPLI